MYEKTKSNFDKINQKRSEMIAALPPNAKPFVQAILDDEVIKPEGHKENPVLMYS